MNDWAPIAYAAACATASILLLRPQGSFAVMHTAHLRSGMLSIQLYKSPMSYVMLRNCGLSSRNRRSKSLQMPAEAGDTVGACT